MPVGGFPVELLLQNAIAKGVPIETMERLLAMRKELKAEAAKEAFDAAMSRFQETCPVIEKTKKVMNKDGRSVRYVYAPIDSIISQVGHLIGKQGLSYTFDVIQDDTTVTAICRVKHSLGHMETTNFRIPIDKESFMSGPQRFAAALTFGKRYAFCNAFGIATGDEDTDATDVDAPTVVQAPKPVAAAPLPVNPPPPAKTPLIEKTRDELMRELHVLLKKYGMPHKAFCDAYQVDSMKDINDDLVRKAIAGLRTRTNAGEVWRDPSLPAIEVEIPAPTPVESPDDEISVDEVVAMLGKPGDAPAAPVSKFKEQAGAAMAKTQEALRAEAKN